MIAFFRFFQIASAAQFGNFTYTDSGTEITITAYPMNLTGSVAIPALINGKPVKQIGVMAFRSCQLSAVTIPSSVTTIGNLAFLDCTKLASVTLSEGLLKISYGSFSGCAFANVTIPASVSLIESDAFEDCETLASITVAAGNWSYSSDNGVLFSKSKTVLLRCPPKRSGPYAIPSTVTTIGPSAFDQCRSLTAISIPTSVASIGAYAFSSCVKIPAVNLPANLTLLDFGAFYRCESLTKVVVPPGIKTLEYNVFSGCKKLNSVTLPDTLTSIEQEAFANCAALPAITIPSGVAEIDDHAFYNCVSLKSISIPTNVNSIGFSAFAPCSSLGSITVDASNSYYCSIDGVLFDKPLTTLIQCPGAKGGSYIIPQGISVVGSSAFNGCSRITGVTIPSTVTSIRHSAFSQCRLTKVSLPVGLATLEESAFQSCPLLVEAIFAGNAPTMGIHVFDGAAAGFTIRYYNNRTGFTSPTWPSWSNYPTVSAGDLTEMPPDIQVEKLGAVVLASGETSTLPAALTGAASTTVFTIRNTGTADLTGLSISESGDVSDEFQVTALPADYAVAGQSFSFQVIFSPKTVGVRNATLLISSNDSDENPFEIQLAGTGMALPVPEIQVSHPVGSSLIDGVTKKSFGTVKKGSQSQAKTFTVTNTGTAALSGLAVSIKGAVPGDFQSTQPTRQSLAPGESATFKVTFKPTAKGTRTAAIRLTSNDADENPFDIKLTGMGVK